MRRNVLNFVIELVTLPVILGMAATGLMIRYVLPPGSGGRRGGPGLVLWGLGRHNWGSVHFWLAVALAALLVLHVALHWTWVCVTVRGIGRPQRIPRAGPVGWARNLCGIGFLAFLVVLVGGFLWLGRASVVITPGQGVSEGGGRGFRGGRAGLVVPAHGNQEMKERRDDRRPRGWRRGIAGRWDDHPLVGNGFVGRYRLCLENAHED